MRGVSCFSLRNSEPHFTWVEDEAVRWKIRHPAAPGIDSRHALGALGTSSDPRLRWVDHLWLRNRDSVYYNYIGIIGQPQVE